MTSLRRLWKKKFRATSRSPSPYSFRGSIAAQYVLEDCQELTQDTAMLRRLSGDYQDINVKIYTFLVKFVKKFKTLLIEEEVMENTLQNAKPSEIHIYQATDCLCLVGKLILLSSQLHDKVLKKPIHFLMLHHDTVSKRCFAAFINEITCWMSSKFKAQSSRVKI